MRFLIFVSILFCQMSDIRLSDTRLSDFRQSDVLSSEVGYRISENRTSENHFWLPQLRDSVQMNRYRIAMSKDNMNISGIWVVMNVDGEWRGTMVNEFGMKMFDFTCNAKNCKLLNVVSVINKWHIRRTIANDLQFILEIDNPAYKTGRRADRHMSDDILIISYKKNKMLQRFASGEMLMHNRKRNLTYSFLVIE